MASTIPPPLPPFLPADGILEETEEERLSHAVLRQRQRVERAGPKQGRRPGLLALLENIEILRGLPKDIIRLFRNGNLKVGVLMRSCMVCVWGGNAPPPRDSKGVFKSWVAARPLPAGPFMRHSANNTGWATLQPCWGRVYKAQAGCPSAGAHCFPLLLFTGVCTRGKAVGWHGGAALRAVGGCVGDGALRDRGGGKGF